MNPQVVTQFPKPTRGYENGPPCPICGSPTIARTSTVTVSYISAAPITPSVNSREPEATNTRAFLHKQQPTFRTLQPKEHYSPALLAHMDFAMRFGTQIMVSAENVLGSSQYGRLTVML